MTANIASNRISKNLLYTKEVLKGNAIIWFLCITQIVFLSSLFFSYFLWYLRKVPSSNDIEVTRKQDKKIMNQVLLFSTAPYIYGVNFQNKSEITIIWVLGTSPQSIFTLLSISTKLVFDR